MQAGEVVHQLAGDRLLCGRVREAAELGDARGAAGQDRLEAWVLGDELRRLDAAAGDGAIDLGFAAHRIGLDAGRTRRPVA